MALGQTFGTLGSAVPHLAHQPVDQHDRRPFAAIHGLQARAAHRFQGPDLRMGASIHARAIRVAGAKGRSMRGRLPRRICGTSQSFPAGFPRAIALHGAQDATRDILGREDQNEARAPPSNMPVWMY